jgi:hypothetical protein
VLVEQTAVVGSRGRHDVDVATHRHVAERPIRTFSRGAPIDDEPVSAEEETAVAEVAADRSCRRADCSFEEVKGNFRARSVA